MIGSMKDIKRRIKSIESTAQITKAMELVASSKLRKAKERAAKAKPYFDMLYETMCDIYKTNIDFTSVFTRERTIKSSLFIVIAGDRGLAGGYNSNLFKLANATINTKNSAKVIAIGKKACEFYSKSNVEVVAQFPSIAEDIDQISVNKIAKIAVSLYKKGEADEICLYYTEFVSALTQEPKEMAILPLSFKNEEKTSLSVVEYEPDPEDVFDAIVPEYISGMIYGAVIESFASEQGARRTAMEAANDNAGDMIDELSLSYNRARQAAITQEISEIVSGANAT